MFFEDLQMWYTTAGREPFLSAYKKAEVIHNEGYKVDIVWHAHDFIEVKRGEPIEGTVVKLKQFKQKNKRPEKKKKERRF